MKNKAYNLSVYSFQQNETILFDANVWLYLYPAPSGIQSPYVAGYSGGLKSIQMAGAHLVVDAIVLSEYLNSYCRIEWRANHKGTYPQFKAFRNSTDFTGIGKRAAAYARQILKQSTPCDHPFTQTNVVQVLTDFETGANDFNDGLLAETCRIHGWKLVTNDSDFTSGGIVVLTTNPKLLRACP
jgi:predicted nucleic acid-binding protein